MQWIQWPCLALLCVVEMFGLMAPGAPLLRGGHRQKRRLAEEMPLRRGEFESSPLGTGLLIKWAEGQLSATDVKELCLLAVQSGCDHPEVQWLASLSPTNCSRALYKKYLDESSLPEPFIVKLPLLENKDRTEPVETDVAIFLAHDWFHYIATYYPSDFDSIFGSVQDIWRWWEKQNRRNPKFVGHPMLKTKNWEKMYYPLALHGDGVQFQQRDQLLTISMKPLLYKRSTKDSHLLLAAIPKSVCTPQVWPIIWQVIGWSLQALLDGKHPKQDPFGEEWPIDSPRAQLAGTSLHPHGLAAVVWGIVGDLDFFNKDLGMPAHNANMFCWRCQCDRAQRPWNDFRPTAAWRATILAPEVVRDTPRSCNLFKYAGLNVLFLMFDLMHTGDQGVILHLVANILFTIAVFDMAPGDPSANFDILWQRLGEIYKELDLEHVLTKLVFSQICDPKHMHSSFPWLGKVKAAEARHLLQCVAKLAAEYQNDDDMHQRRTRCVKALVQVYQLLERSGQVVDNYPALQAAAQQFLMHYQVLAKKAMEQGRLLYSTVNKFHFFEHLVQQAEFENPMLYWAYSGEDFVGRIARIGHLCLPGKPTHLITPVLLHRYAIGLHLRLTRLA